MSASTLFDKRISRRRFLGVLSGMGVLFSGTALSSQPSVVTDQPAFFAASTPGGFGGFKPFDVNGVEVELDAVLDQAGAKRVWTINPSGRLVADGTPDVDDGLVIGVRDIFGNDVQLVIESSAPGECYATLDELAKLTSKDLSGRTLFGRLGYYQTNKGLLAGKFDNLSSPTAFKAAPTNQPAADLITTSAWSYVSGPIWEEAAIVSHTTPNTQGNVLFEGIYFRKDYGTEDKLVGNVTGRASIFEVNERGNPDNVSFVACHFRSDAPVARKTGLRPAKRSKGLDVRGGSRISLSRCTFEYLCIGVVLIGRKHRVDRCIQRYCWDDSVEILDDCEDIEITNNICHDWIGDHGYHPDFIHIYEQKGGKSQTGLSVIGNVVFPGIEGHLAPAWPTTPLSGTLSRDKAYIVGDLAIGPSDRGRFIIIDASNAPSKITLSDPTSTSQELDLAIQARFRPAHPIVIDASGFNLYDANARKNVSASVLIEPWETVTLRLQPQNRRWAIYRSGPVYQGLFTNTITNGVNNLDVRYNIFWLTGAVNGIRIDGTNSNGAKISQNFLGTPWPGDLNSSGNANSVSNGGPSALPIVIHQGSNFVVNGNFAAKVPLGTTVDRSNTVGNHVNMMVWDQVVDNFNVADEGTRIHLPVTFADAIALARPKQGSLYASKGSGPLGPALDGSEDSYNFGQLAGPLGPRA